MIASMSFTQFQLMPRICRWDMSGNTFSYMNLVRIQERRVNRNVLTSVSRKQTTDPLSQELPDEEAPIVEKKTRKTTKRAPAKSKKKALESPVEDSAVEENAKDEQISASTEATTKTQTKTRKKAVPKSKTSEEEEEPPKKVTRQRKPKKKADVIDDQISVMECIEPENDIFAPTPDEEIDQELEFAIENGEDISYTYGWPPLVCCFGAAQNAFVPSGRRANRLIDYEIHDRKRDALWEPEKFVRASGGSSSNVAVALASLGGKVAFMGKLGDDAYGQSLLYYLNVNHVQTRSVRIDDDRTTAVTQMKIGRMGGGLRMTGGKMCAEDCLLKSEINVDVLKEAKMFYFNTFSLLDRNMRSTLLQAVKISKKLGNLVFYDLNLPLPLWQSSEETKEFIQTVWNLSDIIEVTKQELEFLCGITPSEEFDTRDNNRNKFTHYSPEIVSQLWHENLKVLFVTNGTSKIHYYTKEHNGSVYGMEDAPLTPYTSDMSASGDGVVAGIMRMLTVQPHLVLDKKYLERTVKYAINCGVIDQWLQARKLGYPPKEGMEDVESDPHGIKSITEKEYRTLVPST